MRQDKDFYPTPDWVIELLCNQVFPELDIYSDDILMEPCVGSGNIVRVLANHGFKHWYTCDINKNDEIHNLGHVIYEHGVCDFLDETLIPTNVYKNEHKVHAVITNPPFSLAKEFIQKSLAISNITIMLLRLSFLGSQGRTWLDANMPNVYVIPKRIQFLEGINPENRKKYSSDNSEYGWFVWDSNRKFDSGIIKRLKMN